MEGVEGCLCGKLGFPEEAKVPPGTPQRPRTPQGNLSSALEGAPQKARPRIGSGGQHGVRLQMGNGPHHHCCGEGKYLAVNRSAKPLIAMIKLIAFFPKVGLVTMLVVLIPAACMICYHSYVRFKANCYCASGVCLYL